MAQGQPTPVWLHYCLKAGQYVAARIPTDPVVEPSASVRAPGWDPVEQVGHMSPYPLPLHPWVGSLAPLGQQAYVCWPTTRARMPEYVVCFPA